LNSKYFGHGHPKADAHDIVQAQRGSINSSTFHSKVEFEVDAQMLATKFA
jgi:hypothetical protein